MSPEEIKIARDLIKFSHPKFGNALNSAIDAYEFLKFERDCLNEENDKLRAENFLLHNALDFYADEKNWNFPEILDRLPINSIDCDRGNCAAKALGK